MTGSGRQCIQLEEMMGSIGKELKWETKDGYGAGSDVWWAGGILDVEGAERGGKWVREMRKEERY